MKKLFALLAATVLCGSAFAQITNNDFETWTVTGSYNNPTNWDNLNSMTTSMSVYTCNKGNPGVSGSSYIQLTSKTVSGMGVMPGVATCGVLDMASFMPVSGFAYTGRPANLTGSWQYMGFSGDIGHISVLLTKWNAGMNMRDTVAFVDHSLSGMVMSWATFTIPLTYHSTATPDSAIILLSASGSIPANNSYLYVDNLAFAGSPTGIASIANNSTLLSVYPNPTTNASVISYNSASGNDIEITVSDLVGKGLTKSLFHVVAGANSIPLNVSGLAKGIYLITVAEGTKTQTKKIVVE